MGLVRRISAILAVLTVLVALAALPRTAPAETADVGARIVGGSPAAAGSWPSFAELLVRVGANTYLCGGSLITPTVVLTAAHCVNGATAASSTARIGITTINTGTAITWRRATMHPSFDATTLDHDIALVELASASAAPTMSLIPPSADALLNPGTMLSVAGFGKTSTGGSISSTLLEVSIPLVANTTCQTSYNTAGYFYDTTNMLCAGTDSEDSCNGDSGGALTLTVGSVKYATGLVSWGPNTGCATPGLYGVYTRLPAFREWVAVQLASPTITAVRNAGTTVTVEWSHGSPTAAQVPVTFDVTGGGASTTAGSSATSAQLTVASGGALTVGVAARSGTEETSASWAGTPTATRAPIMAVTLAGTASTGSTLTATASSDDPWSSAPGFQWSRDGVPISGATGSTYTLTDLDAGRRISVTAASGNAAGTGTATAFADVAAARTAPTFARSTVLIRGTRKVGAKLGVTAPKVVANPAARITYQWLRNGKAIKGKTKRTYVVVKADRGKRLTCRITAKNAVGTKKIVSRPARIPAP